MLKNINKKKFSEGFTLVEILVVLVIVAILAGLSFMAYSIYVDKGRASESQILLKDVAGASKRYEAVHGGTQTSLDELEAEAYIKLDKALKEKWKIEISGDLFTATSTDAMEGGAGKELRYNRRDGTFSGYGIQVTE